MESPNQNNLTALHHASYRGHYYTAEWLIKNGCNVNAKSHLGNTPLIMATKNGLTNTCRTLIDFGADVNAVNNEGENAYDVAKQNRKTDTYEFLSSVSSAPTPQEVCKNASPKEGTTIPSKDITQTFADAKRTDVPNPILMAARSALKSGNDT